MTNVQRITLLLVLSACGCTTITEFGEPEGSTGEAAESSSTGWPTFPDPSATSGVPDPASTSTGDASSSDSGDDFTTLGFIQDTDTGVSIECDVWEQDCPQGEKCMPWANDGGNAWNATRCSPIDPDPDGLYDPCMVEGSGVSGIDSCDLGMICWDVDERGMGVCHGLCLGPQTAPSCEDRNATCTVTSDGILNLCRPPCQPLDIDTCSPGQGCYPSDDGFVCAPDASGDTLGGAFDTCEFINACDPGLMCAGASLVGACEPGGANCCTPYCDLSDPVCPDPTSCIALFPEGEAPRPHENLGVCGTPEEA